MVRCVFCLLSFIFFVCRLVESKLINVCGYVQFASALIAQLKLCGFDMDDRTSAAIVLVLRIVKLNRMIVYLLDGFPGERESCFCF